MAYEIKSRLAKELETKLTTSHVFQYDTADNIQLSSLLGHGYRTQFDDAWVKSLYTDTSTNTGTSDNPDNPKDSFWTRLPLFGFQIPRCISEIGYCAEKLALPDAFDRYCQSLNDRQAAKLRNILLAHDVSMSINPVSEPNVQKVFMEHLAKSTKYLHISLNPFPALGT